MKTPSELLDEMFPYYLALGMPSNEYWYGEPALVKAYRKAHEYRVEMKNQELWLQGLYIEDAFGVVLANAFRGKNSPIEKYLEKPLDILNRAQKSKEEEDAEAREKLIKALTAWKQDWDMAKGGKQNGSSSQ